MDHVQYWLNFGRHSPLGILTDLDGTLIPFAAHVSEARVDPALAALLAELAASPGVFLAVVSGRTRDSLEGELGQFAQIGLVAEHGGWMRWEGAWRAPVEHERGELDQLAAELERIALQYPRAWVERKTWSVALHYREVKRAARTGLLVQASAAFASLLQGKGYEICEGSQVFEVRLASVRKSAAMPWLRERAGANTRLLVLGDDLTDEDMFRALSPADEAVHVGEGDGRATAARWHLADPEAARAFLEWLRNARRDEPTLPPTVLPARVTPPRAAATAKKSPWSLMAISNRLPDLRAPTDPEEVRTRNVGGLVSALEPVLAKRGGIWLGWSGRTTAGDEPGAVELSSDANPPLAWLDFPRAWVERYYNGFCNRSLWPLFHSFPARVRFADEEWECYGAANDAFAAAASEMLGSDAVVWVHDYHALLVARALRRRGHRGPIGLFLHVPFPPLEMFAVIPWAEELLDAMLEFDLLAFHTPDYVHNFRHCVDVLSPARLSDDAILHRSRRIRTTALPIGIMPEGFREAPEPGTADEINAVLQAIAPTRLVLGVDRLDYTKGIPERLRAFGRLFELNREWRGKVSLIQISVPSRADVPEYAEQRALIESVVGRINGEFGEASWVPIRYLYRSYGRNQLAQLYRAASVGYITPLRDGMNLVAKEYVAAQDPENPGVLLLSRFAGAAVELKDAVLTNPYYLDGMARDLDRALRMPLPERRDRHAKLTTVISRTTAVTWAEDFLRLLESCR